MSRPTIHRAESLSSASSFSSLSDANVDTDADSQTAIAKPNEPRRTRKRFSREQLIVLEQAYHKSSHPARTEREQIAQQADMNFKSVTIWFQNKRQAERKLALNNERLRTAPPPLVMYPTHSSAAQLASDDSSSRPGLLSSQSCTLSSIPQPRVPARTASGFISLDRIASRTERAPRTPPKLTRHTSFYEPRPRSPEALWDSMLSSPIQPEKEDKARDTIQESPSVRDYLDFARRTSHGFRLRGRRTLEWACAAARVTVDKEDDTIEPAECDESLPKLSFSIDNESTLIDDDASTEIVDTEMESLGDSHEAITPGASQIMFTDNPSPTLRAIPMNIEEKKTSHAAMNIDAHEPEKDSEILDAAWALCGLSTLRK